MHGICLDFIHQHRNEPVGTNLSHTLGIRKEDSFWKKKNNKWWLSGLLEFVVSLFPKISHHKVAGGVIRADSESVACCWKVNSSRGFLNIESSCFPVFRKRSTMGLTHEHISKHLQGTRARTKDSDGRRATPPRQEPLCVTGVSSILIDMGVKSVLWAWTVHRFHGRLVVWHLCY